jgi:TonB family protein
VSPTLFGLRSARMIGIALLLGSSFTVQAQAVPHSALVQTATDPHAGPAGASGASGASSAPLVLPEYPGGDRALITFLSANLRYPSDAFEAGAAGKVDVSFWIDETGHPYGFGAVQSPHPSLSAEAIRVMKLMPNWKPGQREGRPTPMIVHVPVVFRGPNAN